LEFAPSGLKQKPSSSVHYTTHFHMPCKALKIVRAPQTCTTPSLQELSYLSINAAPESTLGMEKRGPRNHTVTAALYGQAKVGDHKVFFTHSKSTSVSMLSVQCSVRVFKLPPFWSRSHILIKLAVLPGNNKDTMHFSSAFHQIIPTYFTNRIKEASQHPCEVGGNSYTRFTGGENRH